MGNRPNHEDYATRDVYMFFDFEEALMRYDYKTKKKYVKFLDDDRETLHATDSKFANDIRAFGCEITKEEYDSCTINPDRKTD